MMNTQECGTTVLSIITAILNSEYQTAAELIDEVEREDMFQVIGSITAAFGAALDGLAQLTGRDRDSVRDRLLADMGSTIASPNYGKN